MFCENPVSHKRVAAMSIADPLVTKVIEHSLNCLYSIDTLWESFGLGWHVLHCEDVHLLVFIPQVLREHITKGLSTTKDGQRFLWIVNVG